MMLWDGFALLVHLPVVHLCSYLSLSLLGLCSGKRQNNPNSLPHALEVLFLSYSQIHISSFPLNCTTVFQVQSALELKLRSNSTEHTLSPWYPHKVSQDWMSGSVGLIADENHFLWWAQLEKNRSVAVKCKSHSSRHMRKTAFTEIRKEALSPANFYSGTHSIGTWAEELSWPLNEFTCTLFYSLLA